MKTIPSELIPSDPRFGSGPSLIPTSFVENLLKTDKHVLGTSHRKPAVKNLVRDIQEGLKDYFGLKDNQRVLLGNGGATFLFDAIGLGLVEKKSLHFTCGEFSKKWAKSHQKIPWIEVEEKSVDFGEGIDPHSDTDADLIACTLNETSTGVQLATLAEQNGKGLVTVDATSGGGQVPCDVNKTDLFFFSPQKVFASDGGLFVAIASEKCIERALKIQSDSSRYIPDIMNWKTIIDNSEKNQTYNTPAIATLFFLKEQVQLMQKLGYKKVCEEAKQKADLLYSWAQDKDYLSPFVKEEKYRSHAVATIDVDERIKVDEIVSHLASEKLVYGIEAYRKLGRNQFRIALFHNISFTDLEKLTKLLSYLAE